MRYHVIYDSTCNLCSNWVQILETLDQGKQFDYIPMQDAIAIAQFGITPQDCEQGVILIDAQSPQRRWQGSDAAEEVGRLLPMGEVLVQAYRTLPGVKWLGDRAYEQIRDNRYAWFGKCSTPYQSRYPACASQLNNSNT
ncbi:MAG: DCC1-like thiol-disulfide oxidoreductase family protein [Desertifilum sp.]|nr:DCC1-like thiol-disulfide oxidoreductase family protein [Desertifilum sp.]